jgi:hypothetical protein
MQFYEVLAQVIELLQRQGQVSYRALKRQFDLDNDDPEDAIPLLPLPILREKGFAVLVRQLGPANALRFLHL